MPPKSKSAVWNSFDLVDGGKETRCKLCQTKLSYNASTTAMQNHLRAKHSLALGAATTSSTSGGRAEHFNVENWLRIVFRSSDVTPADHLVLMPQCCNVEKHFKFKFKYPSRLAKNADPFISVAVCWVVAATY